MPVPVKTVTEETGPYSVNKVLFDEATSVKDKMKLIQGRLQKMEEHRADVSDSVYLKVRTDYEVQLDEVVKIFEEKCREVESELRHLYQAQEEQNNLLAGHQEVLEEAKFRHKLGEFNDKKFKDVETQENKEIKKYNDLLDTIKGTIKQYEDVLGRTFEPDAPSPKPAAPVKKAEPPPPPAPKPVVEAKPSATVAPAPAPAAAPPPAFREEDTQKNQVQSQPILVKEEEPVTSETPMLDTGFEDKLSDELDMFLETEGDYFSQEPESAAAAAAAPVPEVTLGAPTPQSASNPAPVSKSKPVEDSISTILRDIPLDDDAGGTAVTKGASEETGANIDIREIPAEASLLLIEGDLDESEFILGENTSIGRSPSNDIVLKESKVSRQHAAINLRNNHYVIIDLKSSNGILVNGRKVEEASLQDGDEVTVGSFKFQFNLA